MKTFLLSFFLAHTVLFSFASQNRKVLLIGIDGVRSDALQQANTPNIDGLLSNSLYTYSSWHTGITWSGPSWSTILTGVNWNKHGVTSNSFAGRKFDQYAPLPTLAKQILPNLNCAFVAEWHPLIDSINNAAWNRAIKVPDMETWITADSAVAQLQNPDIDLLFAYFDRVDMTGHFSSFSPTNPLYISAIQNVDSAVGKLLDTLYARPTYNTENWLIMLFTDHGGNGFMHGGNSLEERTIWWIATGSVVAHQQINQADPGTYSCNGGTFDTTFVNYSLLRQSPVQTDITVTALHHLIYETGINPETKPEWNLDGKSWLINSSHVNEIYAEGNVSVFPNPNNGTFTITGLDFAAERKLPIEIFSMEGKLIFSALPEANELNVTSSQLQNGLYLLKVGNMNKKLVIN
ncbi:MAG: alkaline phosphatase family protein [Chitinophagales bacterium]|nr:alkaline phosphatase family protein [Chitinophagales bacterium]